MDPYSSPYIFPNNNSHNPFPPFPTKNQKDVAREDRDSEGLLLLTTDGHFTHFATAPDKSFEKDTSLSGS